LVNAGKKRLQEEEQSGKQSGVKGDKRNYRSENSSVRLLLLIAPAESPLSEQNIPTAKIRFI